ncbi:hypothetical protein IJG12_02650 [Candidatus Saccharibacteria bacterium]|nr:hypothetical protein [Candidatus Saccharibacteria bacterium]
MAKVFREVGRSTSVTIKEKTGYMRIKRPKRRNSGQKEAKIAPAPWQEFIEI